MSVIENIMDIPMQYSQEIFGQFDVNIKKIEKTLHVTIISRGSVDWTTSTVFTTFFIRFLLRKLFGIYQLFAPVMEAS